MSEHKDDKNILRCHTAKFKLKEAKFFLDLLLRQENWSEDDNVTFFLNAFVISSSSVIEYVNSDFLYNKIKEPRIKWNTWKKESQRNKIISSHPNAKAIKNFLDDFSKARENLLDDPLVNYFVYKRNKIVHMHWDGSKSGFFSETLDGKKTINERKFEALYRLLMVNKKPDLDLDLFSDDIPKDVQIKTLARLCEEPLENIAEEYLEKLQEFIDMFDGKNFFLNS